VFIVSELGGSIGESKLSENFIQGLFSGMAKRGVADVVAKSDGFDQVFIQGQGSADTAGNLGDFQAVGEPSSVVVTLWFDEDLGFVLEASKGLGMKNTISITLKGSSDWVRGFRDWSPPGFR
jgi:hypothetical protein